MPRLNGEDAAAVCAPMTAAAALSLGIHAQAIRLSIMQYQGNL
jgi:hypothetical protein